METNRSIRSTAFANRDAAPAGPEPPEPAFSVCPSRTSRPGVALTVTTRPPASLCLAVLSQRFRTHARRCAYLFVALTVTARPPVLPHPPAFRIPLLFLWMRSGNAPTVAHDAVAQPCDLPHGTSYFTDGVQKMQETSAPFVHPPHRSYGYARPVNPMRFLCNAGSITRESARGTGIEVVRGASHGRKTNSKQYHCRTT